MDEKYITAYMTALNEKVGLKNIAGEILLYITPPDRTDLIDRYFEMGADRIACSLEVWDDALGAVITPGKREFTTKARHLDALTYIAENYGPGKALCNFIIGLEPLESLTAGATNIAERGIIPNASVWMPFGRPVMGSMKTPSVDYYRAVKEMLADLYVRYDLYPAGKCGLNVCVDNDIRKWASNEKCC